MSQPASRTIEFIYGPFDGHVEPLLTQPEQLPQRLVCYVSENVFRMFEGKNAIDDSSVTSIALYERCFLVHRWVYIFRAAMKPKPAKARPN